MEFPCSPHPKFLVRDSHSEIAVILEGVLLVVREKFKNETVATFYDVCGVFSPKNYHLFTFAFGLKVIQCFKAKMEAFRERPSSKVESVLFLLHLTPNFLGRDEIRFLRFPSRNLAHTRILTSVLLYVIVLTLDGISPVHF